MRVEPIDLRPFREGSDVERRRLAEQFDRAARTSGFLSISGHGVDPELAAEMLDVTAAFFDLDPADKMTYFVEDRAANRGYAPEGSEALAYSLGEQDLPTDLFEAFNCGLELSDAQLADPYYAARRDTLFAPNVWPSPLFRATWLGYLAAVDRVANDVMSVAALALGMPADHFEPYLDKGPTVMRANNYQRRSHADEPKPDQMRMGAHTDYGSITVLLADPVPGLQICDDAGRWHDVVPSGDSFIVNVGDLLAEWSNDRWRSTLHRVVPPNPGSAGPVRRRSVAWFQQPNWDAVIECLPTCCDDSNPPRYAPVTSGDHLMAKLMGPRLLEPSKPSRRT
ncbi:MAG TPA: 2OG-Fe(II) oxygenase family protein [Ilumatobacteraceae bacterium]|nr:2OG-Fe(II) oxygenase family protein [Ilumatobacteraceae bacterium]